MRSFHLIQKLNLGWLYYGRISCDAVDFAKASIIWTNKLGNKSFAPGYLQGIDTKKAPFLKQKGVTFLTMRDALLPSSSYTRLDQRWNEIELCANSDDDESNC